MLEKKVESRSPVSQLGHLKYGDGHLEKYNELLKEIARKNKFTHLIK